MATAVGSDMGDVGLPSLAEASEAVLKAAAAGIEGLRGLSASDLAPLFFSMSFGSLYSGFEAIGLRLHPLEVYAEFLRQHSGRGHKLQFLGPDPPDEIEYRFVAYESPRDVPGYCRAQVRFGCGRCKDDYDSDRGRVGPSLRAPHHSDGRELSRSCAKRCSRGTRIPTSACPSIWT